MSERARFARLFHVKQIGARFAWRRLRWVVGLAVRDAYASSAAAGPWTELWLAAGERASPEAGLWLEVAAYSPRTGMATVRSIGGDAEPPEALVWRGQDFYVRWWQLRRVHPGHERRFQISLQSVTAMAAMFHVGDAERPDEPPSIVVIQPGQMFGLYSDAGRRVARFKLAKADEKSAVFHAVREDGAIDFPTRMFVGDSINITVSHPQEDHNAA